jgi:hypothetical protein
MRLDLVLRHHRELAEELLGLEEGVRLADVAQRERARQQRADLARLDRVEDGAEVLGRAEARARRSQLMPQTRPR